MDRFLYDRDLRHARVNGVSSDQFLVAANCSKIYTAQKMKFSMEDFFSKCDKSRRVTLTEEILNGTVFACAVYKQFESPVLLKI